MLDRSTGTDYSERMSIIVDIHNVPLLSGLAVVADRYDALLCDVWGVLHNGKTAFPGVSDALCTFRKRGGRVLLLSNAPRPGEALPPQLEGFGIAAEAYDGILTSGDATRAFLETASLGSRVLHIGPDRDLPLFEGIDIELVGEDKADFVLVTGLFDDDTESPDDYAGALSRWEGKGLALVCANPDIIVDRGHTQIYCAGALARVYEELGGVVIYFGKPHAPIYGLARQRLAGIHGSVIPDNRILAIGDGIGTDMLGAQGEGIDALFITGGIAAARFGDNVKEPDPALLAAFCHEAGVKPVAALPRLVWGA